MNGGDLHKVWEIRALKRKPRQEEAQKMLEKIAKQVQPIMSKRKWRVKLLSEFCPTNARLLGVNVGGGVNVKLRLRRPNRDLDFIPYDQVLDTMLHELCHIAHGPHNASFYKLWDELRKECEELIAKGITGSGEGFDVQGRRLGGFSRQPSLSSLRKTAAAAAEKRAKLGSLLPSGPNRLGGDCTIKDALSPIQAAAMAAERRLQDEIWCGSQSADVSGDGESCSDDAEDLVELEQHKGFPTSSHGRKRNLESKDSPAYSSFTGWPRSSLVDLTTDASTSGLKFSNETRPMKRTCNSYKDSSFGSSFNGESPSIKLTDSFAGSLYDKDKTGNPTDHGMWQCGTCTLLNPPLAPVCELCSSAKPRDFGTKHKVWSCKFCTLENDVKLDKCSACEQWRFSHGPPVSVRSYLGT